MVYNSSLFAEIDSFDMYTHVSLDTAGFESTHANPPRLGCVPLFVSKRDT